MRHSKPSAISVGGSTNNSPARVAFWALVDACALTRGSRSDPAARTATVRARAANARRISVTLHSLSKGFTAETTVTNRDFRQPRLKPRPTYALTKKNLRSLRA